MSLIDPLGQILLQSENIYEQDSPLDLTATLDRIYQKIPVTRGVYKEDFFALKFNFSLVCVHGDSSCSLLFHSV